MPAITFDTLKFARRLKEAGVPEGQAEAEAEALAEVFQTNLADFATKRDLTELALELKGEIRLLRWMVGFALAGIMGVLLMLFRLFMILPGL